MLGELKRYFRDSGWAVHVPRAAQEQALALAAVSDELSRSLSRSPTVAELAKAMGVGQEDVLNAIHASNAHDTVSLDARRPGRDEENDTYADTLGQEDAQLDLAEYLVDVVSNMVILHLRFAQDLTQTEIAERIGVSQMQVSRLLRRALGRLREAVGDE
jgi:RNA polymerase sigma-B factor